MKRHMVWEIDPTMGAVKALTENSKVMTHEMMERCEELAIEHSKADGYPPAITSVDVLQVVEEHKNGFIFKTPPCEHYYKGKGK